MRSALLLGFVFLPLSALSLGCGGSGRADGDTETTVDGDRDQPDVECARKICQPGSRCQGSLLLTIAELQEVCEGRPCREAVRYCQDGCVAEPAAHCREDEDADGDAIADGDGEGDIPDGDRDSDPELTCQGAAGDACPYNGVVNTDCPLCIDSECLGIEPLPESSCALDKDCLREYATEWNPVCVGGRCGASFCAPLCGSNFACPCTFGPQMVGGQCYCIPGALSSCWVESDPGDPCELDGMWPGEKCEQDQTCLGIPPDPELACAVNEDCLAYLPASRRPFCVEGACGESYCALRCAVGGGMQCSEGFMAEDISGLCYCIPEPFPNDGDATADGDHEADVDIDDEHSLLDDLSPACRELLTPEADLTAGRINQARLAEAVAHPDMQFGWMMMVRQMPDLDRAFAASCMIEYLGLLGFNVPEPPFDRFFSVVSTFTAIEPALRRAVVEEIGIICHDPNYCDCFHRTPAECPGNPFCRVMDAFPVDLTTGCYGPDNEPVGCYPTDEGCLGIDRYGTAPDGSCWLFGGDCGIGQMPGWTAGDSGVCTGSSVPNGRCPERR